MRDIIPATTDAGSPLGGESSVTCTEPHCEMFGLDHAAERPGDVVHVASCASGDGWRVAVERLGDPGGDEWAVWGQYTDGDFPLTREEFASFATSLERAFASAEELNGGGSL